MIEILILYIIHKREKTLYSIRKDITELFGTFTKPSIGTIFPALKRLLKEDAVSVYEKMSNGGKKSSYYSITKKGLDVFKKYFFDDASDNPSLFYTQLQARIGTMGLLKAEDKKVFIDEAKQKVELYKLELERKINDEFLSADYYQKCLFDKTLKDLHDLEKFLGSIKL